MKRWLVLIIPVLALLTGTGCVNQKNHDSDQHFRIAFAYFGPEEACDNAITGFLDGLKEEGFQEGRNLEVLRRHTGGEIANLSPLMQSLDNQGLDLIIPMTTPGVAAACGAVKSTRMVFVYTYDPIAAGAGRNFSDHLPLMTGVASFPSIAETMETIRTMFPKVKKIGTIYTTRG